MPIFIQFAGQAPNISFFLLVLLLSLLLLLFLSIMLLLFLAIMLLRFLDSWLLRSLAIMLLRFLDSGLLRSLDIMLLRFLDSWLLRSLDIMLLRFLDSGCCGLWTSCCCGFWTAGCCGLWTSCLLGFLDSWLLRSLDIMLLRFLGSAADALPLLLLMQSLDTSLLTIPINTIIPFSPYIIPPLMLIPIITVPMPFMIPCPPVAIEIIVVYPVISGWHVVNIFRRYNKDDLRDHRRLNIVPAPIVVGRPEPVVIIEPVPVAAVEIDSIIIRHHIDIACSTGNYVDIRRCGKLQRRRCNDADVDLHLCRRLLRPHEGKQGPEKDDQSQHSVNTFFHFYLPGGRRPH